MSSTPTTWSERGWNWIALGLALLAVLASSCREEHPEPEIVVDPGPPFIIRGGPHVLPTGDILVIVGWDLAWGDPPAY